MVVRHQAKKSNFVAYLQTISFDQPHRDRDLISTAKGRFQPEMLDQPFRTEKLHTLKSVPCILGVFKYSLRFSVLGHIQKSSSLYFLANPL